MKNQALGVQFRDQVARAAHVGENRLGGEDAPERLAVCRFGLLIEKKKASYARRRRPPIHLNHCGSVSGEIAGEAFEPDVDDAQRARQQRVNRHCA
jgi:hypothetical protein